VSAVNQRTWTGEPATASSRNGKIRTIAAIPANREVDVFHLAGSKWRHEIRLRDLLAKRIERNTLLLLGLVRFSAIFELDRLDCKDHKRFRLISRVHQLPQALHMPQFCHDPLTGRGFNPDGHVPLIGDFVIRAKA
jgi:hypothetical protein